VTLGNHSNRKENNLAKIVKRNTGLRSQRVLLGTQKEGEESKEPRSKKRTVQGTLVNS